MKLTVQSVKRRVDAALRDIAYRAGLALLARALRPQPHFVVSFPVGIASVAPVAVTGILAAVADKLADACPHLDIDKVCGKTRAGMAIVSVTAFDVSRDLDDETADEPRASGAGAPGDFDVIAAATQVVEDAIKAQTPTGEATADETRTGGRNA